MADDASRVRVGDRVTIYPRGAKKTWVADFWQDGVHRKVSLKTGNKKVAVERATKLAADLIRGTYHTPPPAVTVRQVVDDYMVYLKTGDRARRTLVKYRGVLDRFVAYLAGHHVTRLGLVKYRGVLDRFVAYLAGHHVTRLGQVTVGHFDRYRAGRRDARHRKTVYNEGVIVKQLFKWARTRKLIADNPLADVRLDKPPLEPKEGPSLAQVDALLAAADEPLRSHLAVLALTGVRAGELQRLRPEELTWPAGGSTSGPGRGRRRRRGSRGRCRSTRGSGRCWRRCRPRTGRGCSVPPQAGSTLRATTTPV